MPSDTFLQHDDWKQPDSMTPKDHDLGQSSSASSDMNGQRDGLGSDPSVPEPKPLKICSFCGFASSSSNLARHRNRKHGVPSGRKLQTESSQSVSEESNLQSSCSTIPPHDSQTTVSSIPTDLLQENHPHRLHCPKSHAVVDDDVGQSYNATDPPLYTSTKDEALRRLSLDDALVHKEYPSPQRYESSLSRQESNWEPSLTLGNSEDRIGSSSPYCPWFEDEEKQEEGLSHEDDVSQTSKRRKTTMTTKHRGKQAVTNVKWSKLV